VMYGRSMHGQLAASRCSLCYALVINNKTKKIWRGPQMCPHNIKSPFLGNSESTGEWGAKTWREDRFHVFERYSPFRVCLSSCSDGKGQHQSWGNRYSPE